MNGMKKMAVFFTAVCLFYLSFSGIEVRAASTDAGQVLCYINQFRAEKGLMPLTMDESLRQAAMVRAAECKSKFSHTRPDGSPWYTAGSNIIGENLAMAENEEQSRSLNVAYAWYISPGHSENILSSRFSQMGLAFYEENGITYIACEFR